MADNPDKVPEVSAIPRATSSDPRSRRAGNWAFAISCLLCGLLALGLRLAAMAEPLWLDELHTGWVVGGSFSDVGPRAIQGNQSPLWFFGVFGIVKAMGGATALSLRIISLAAGVALVVSIGLLVRRCGGHLCGATLAMILAALDDTFIYYAVEARPYACLQLVGLWQTALLGRIVGRSRQCEDSDREDRHAIYAFWSLSALLLWLHLTALAWFLVEAIVVVGMVLGKTREGTKAGNGPGRMIPVAALKLHAVPVVLFLASTLALLPLVMQVRQRAPNWMAIVSVDRYLLLVVAAGVIYLLVPWVASKFMVSRTTVSPALVRNRVIWIALPLVLFLGAVVASLSAGLALADVRFTLLGFTALPVATGLIVARLSNPLACGTVALATVAVALATNPLLSTAARTGQFPVQRSEHWESIIASINSSSLPVILVPNVVEDSPGGNDADASNEEHAGYLDREFALRSLYPLEPNERFLVTLSLQGDLHLSSNEWRTMVREGGAWLLVRAHRKDASQALDEILRQLSKGQATGGGQDDSGTVRVTDFSRPPLYLFRIELIENEAAGILEVPARFF